MDKAKLLQRAGATETEGIEIPGVGVVTVRGLTRYEFLLVQKRADGDPNKAERITLATCMVDPEMTEKDVEEWQKVSPPAEINAVAMVVNRLSGIGPDAPKEAYKSIRD